MNKRVGIICPLCGQKSCHIISSTDTNYLYERFSRTMKCRSCGKTVRRHSAIKKIPNDEHEHIICVDMEPESGTKKGRGGPSSRSLRYFREKGRQDKKWWEK